MGEAGGGEARAAGCWGGGGGARRKRGSRKVRLGEGREGGDEGLGAGGREGEAFPPSSLSSSSAKGASPMRHREHSGNPEVTFEHSTRFLEVLQATPHLPFFLHSRRISQLLPFPSPLLPSILIPPSLSSSFLRNFFSILPSSAVQYREMSAGCVTDLPQGLQG